MFRPNAILAGMTLYDMPDAANVNTKTAALYLGVCRSSLEHGRRADPDHWPPYTRIGSKKVVYNVGQLRAWLKERQNLPVSPRSRRIGNANDNAIREDPARRLAVEGAAAAEATGA